MKMGYTIQEINQLTLDDIKMINNLDFSEDVEGVTEEDVEEISAEDFFKNGFGF